MEGRKRLRSYLLRILTTIARSGRRLRSRSPVEKRQAVSTKIRRGRGSPGRRAVKKASAVRLSKITLENYKLEYEDIPGANARLRKPRKKRGRI